jgi:hypothetical protein
MWVMLRSLLNGESAAALGRASCAILRSVCVRAARVFQALRETVHVAGWIRPTAAGLRAYFMPEDGNSTLYVYDADLVACVDAATDRRFLGPVQGLPPTGDDVADSVSRQESRAIVRDGLARCLSGCIDWRPLRFDLVGGCVFERCSQ